MKVIKGNCIEVLKTLEENSVDSVVTDPPYEIGFMGKSWDSSGIANNPEMWKECLRVLKPGGYLLSFSATRTYHRMAVGIEDAGFEIRDMIEWVYGSGFPKSHNIGKAVDKLQGNEREEFVHKYASRRVEPINSNASHEYGFDTTKKTDTKGTSEYEGWGTALKPAHEPICMARKPLAEKTVAKNCLKYGTGGININESRVGVDINNERRFDLEPAAGNINYKTKGNKDTTWGCLGDRNIGQSTKIRFAQGRFPANLIHDNSEEVRECFPETKSGALKDDQYNSKSDRTSIFAGEGQYVNKGYEADQGNASRFFKSIIYQSKPSKKERNAGCEALEEKQTQGGGGGIGDYKDDVNSMSGKYGSEKAPAKNNHPTVKPIALMEYLIKMVTPKGGVVLDPFMGSGTTGCASVKNGFDFIGIDLEEEYIKIATARINHYKIF